MCGEAVDGLEAVAKAQELKPDLIILDFLMPRMNGLEAARTLQPIMPTVPKILFTLQEDAIPDSVARSVGVCAVVPKSAGLDGLIPNSSELVFHSRRDAPLKATNVLHDGLHPALKSVGLPQAGMHAFRRGCNRRWELAGVNPAVLRQQMGHTSEAMTARYTGEVPIEQVRAAFSGRKIVVSENTENEAVA